MLESNCSWLSDWHFSVLYMLYKIYSKANRFKTAHVYYLTVTVGQKSRYILTGSTAFRSHTSLKSRWQFRGRLQCHLKAQLEKALLPNWLTCLFGRIWFLLGYWNEGQCFSQAIIQRSLSVPWHMDLSIW